MPASTSTLVTNSPGGSWSLSLGGTSLGGGLGPATLSWNVMRDGTPAVSLNFRLLFLFLRDIIIIGSGVGSGLAVPRGIALALPTGAGGAALHSRLASRFFRRRSLRWCV
jgi:hypothetical protein